MTDPAAVIRAIVAPYIKNPDEFRTFKAALDALVARVRSAEEAARVATALMEGAQDAAKELRAERDRLREDVLSALPGGPSCNCRSAVESVLADVPAGDKPKISTSGNTATNLRLEGKLGEPWDVPAGDGE